MTFRLPLFWKLQIGGWLIFWAAMFLAGVTQWPAGYTLVRKSSLAALGFLLTLVLRELYRRFQGWRLPAAIVAILVVALSWGTAAVWMALHNLLITRYATRQLRGFPDFTNAIYYAFVVLAWSLLYFGAGIQLGREGERERLLRAEALAHKARLRALRLQLNPHFLFNTLNAISTLIADQRNTEANRMVSRLSNFLRRTLDSPDVDEIRLRDEIDFARQYLEIEKGRFGERLQVTIDVAESAEEALVPPLILQPLVENAVQYAVARSERGGTVRITASQADGWLTLDVGDDGSGIDEDAEIEPGVGLSNTRERLAQIYGTRSDLRFQRSGAGGLSVAIRLPFRNAPEAAS